MNVGVRAGHRIAAVLAGAARARFRTGAEQSLPQPEREPLLADAERALEQQRAGQGAALDRLLEALAKRLVAMQWKERHRAKLRRRYPPRREVGPVTVGHGS